MHTQQSDTDRLKAGKGKVSMTRLRMCFSCQGYNTPGGSQATALSSWCLALLPYVAAHNANATTRTGRGVEARRGVIRPNIARAR